MADIQQTLRHWAAMRENVSVEEIYCPEFGYEVQDDIGMQIVTVEYQVVTTAKVVIQMSELPGFIGDLMEVEKQRLAKETDNG
jgi:hypothetical protein